VQRQDQPPASSDAATTQPLKVLPNLDIVATGDVPAADRLFLSAYAKQTADHVWTVVIECADPAIAVLIAHDRTSARRATRSATGTSPSRPIKN